MNCTEIFMKSEGEKRKLFKMETQKKQRKLKG